MHKIDHQIFTDISDIKTFRGAFRECLLSQSVEVESLNALSVNNLVKSLDQSQVDFLHGLAGVLDLKLDFFKDLLTFILELMGHKSVCLEPA